MHILPKVVVNGNSFIKLMIKHVSSIIYQSALLTLQIGLALSYTEGSKVLPGMYPYPSSASLIIISFRIDILMLQSM